LFETLKGKLKICTKSSEVQSGTALHQSKDFAVSFSYFYEIIPCGILWLSPQTSLLAPLGLLQTGVTRYSLGW